MRAAAFFHRGLWVLAAWTCLAVFALLALPSWAQTESGGTGTAGLFYFAGHGMQVKGRNFLVSVGANIEHEDELPYQALDAQAVMDKMESAGNGTNIVILDACRNNPFVRSFRSGRQGLAQMDAPVGTLVAFSTAPGSVASDGNGKNGLYTSHLLNAIKQPGQKVEDVFKQVRFAVLRDSARRQVPWEASSLVGDFYFVEAPVGVPQAAMRARPAPGWPRSTTCCARPRTANVTVGPASPWRRPASTRS